MYKGFKIIAVTPAGRRNTLSILLRYTYAHRHIIDEHHLWVNTAVKADQEYITNMCQHFDFFKEVHIKEKLPKREHSIHRIAGFFRYTTEPKTIYIRFDDDIVFIEPNSLTKLLDFRIQYPKYFLVYPFIVNNHHLNRLLLHEKLIPKLDPEAIHLDFINNFLDKRLLRYRFGPYIPDFKKLRVNINCICWFGKEFAKFGGVVNPEEEEWLAIIKPNNMKKQNAVCTDMIVSHLSFSNQDVSANILRQYEIISKLITGSLVPKPNHCATKKPLRIL